ncbi:MAG: dihydroorotase [Lachnospiraceae bacterium]|nr:dihydroorotase [Lachnospiraceae bacterium]
MIVIKNGYVINPKSGFEGKADVLIKDDKIVSIGETEVCENAEVIDATGLVVAPGLVDVHTHFRDPGFEYKEDIDTGAKAAAAGGYTTVIMMCNTKPTIDNVDTLSYVLNKGKETGIHVESCGAVSFGLKGEKLTDMDALAKAGAIGFTDDGIPLMDEAILREAMAKTAAMNMPISLHEEDASLITNNGINRGKASEHFGIGGSPRDAEISLIERDLQIALETNAIVNVQHISSKEGVELVRKAKAVPGNRVHAEATPHHIALTEEAVIAKGTLAKVNPPIRTEEDRLAIIEGLKDGTIDIIATDHAPHAKEEKDKPLTEAPSGMLGLEAALPLCIEKLVKEAGMSMMEVLDKLTAKPAAMYNIDRGDLRVDGPADIVIFNPDEKWTVTGFQSKSQNTPFLGEELTGKVKYTICKGKVVYKD